MITKKEIKENTHTTRKGFAGYLCYTEMHVSGKRLKFDWSNQDGQIGVDHESMQAELLASGVYSKKEYINKLHEYINSQVV